MSKGLIFINLKIKKCWVIIGPIRSTLVHSVQFGYIRSYRSTLVIFGLHQFYSVIFSPFCPPWSSSVHFGLFCPFLLYSVHSVHFGLTRSIFVLIGPFCPHFREKEKKKKNSKIETLSMRRDLIRLGKR